MKTKRFLPLLLILALTGCGAQPAPSQPSAAATEAPAVQETETVTEPLAETEAETEAPTEAPTEPATEAVIIAETEEVPEAADPQEIAYRFIKDELIPQEGLSDLQPYLAIDWQLGSPTCGELEPPVSTQGVISAAVADFSGDGVPELLVIASRGYRFDLNFYKITDDTCLMIGSYSIDGGQSVDNVPKVSIKNGKVIVENSLMVLPGCSHYGNSVTVLSTTDGGVNTLCDLSGYRTPGAMTLNVDGSVKLDKAVDEADDDNNHPDVEQAAMQCLQDAGVDPVSVKAGWSESIGFGIEAQIDGMTLLFDTTSDTESNVRFNDHTGLREKLG